jgi:hypothetical protein
MRRNSGNAENIDKRKELIMKIETAEELKKIQSKMSSLQYEFEKQGYDKSMARNLAADRAGDALVPPVTGEQLKSAVGQALNYFYAEKRNANQLKAYQAAAGGSGSGNGNVNETDEMTDDSGGEWTYYKTYRETCAAFKFVPTDGLMSFLTSMAPGSCAAYRSRLKTEGFIFENVGYGWAVIPPELPEEPIYTESQVRALVEDLIKKLKG